MLKKLATLSSSILIVTVLALFSLSAQARTQIDLGISLQASPPPPIPNTVVMAPPQGYSNCYMTPGGWMGGVWVPPHQECQYPSGPYGSALWVSGYWGCLAVGPDGSCGRWRWYGHHWGRGGHVAYREHRYHRHNW